MKYVPTHTDPLHRMITFALIIIGLPFAGIGIYEAVTTWNELRQGVECEGTVVDNIHQTIEQDGYVGGLWLPTVAFQDDRRATVRFTDNAGSLPPDYEPGDHVSVSYPEGHPELARIASWKRLWLVPTLLLTIGLLPMLVFDVWRRRQRSTKGDGSRSSHYSTTP